MKHRVNILASIFQSDSPHLAALLAHPLRLQSGFHEIHANMWARNGMQMKGQAMTYVQNHFCTSFSDADLFLLQLLAARLPPPLVARSLLARFRLGGWLRDVVRARHQLLAVSERRKVEADSVIANVVEQILEEFEQSGADEASHSERARSG